MSNCIFCVSVCQTKFAIVGGTLKKLKSECLSPDSKKHSGQDNFIHFPGDSVIAEQLRVIFMLKNILKVGEEQLVNILGSSGQLHWISVCLSCGETVKKYYETLKEIGKLEKKLGGYSDELKGHIWRTKEVEGQGPTGPLWESIRNKFINGTETECENQENLLVEGCEIESKPVIVATLSLAPQPEAKTENLSNLEPDSDWEPEELEQKPESDDDYAPSRSSNRGKRKASQVQKTDKNVIRFVKTTNPNYTAFYRGTTRHYACRKCPATDTYPSLMEAHIKLHEEGSGAIPCPLCGWFMLPNRMNYHYGKRHPLPEGRRSGKGVIYPEKKYHFKCPDCSALLTSIGKYRQHEALHRTGGGTVCSKCKWLTPRMANHLAYWHANRKIPRREIKLMGENGNYQPRKLLKKRVKPEVTDVGKVKQEIIDDPLETMNAEWTVGGFVEESNMSAPTSSHSEHRSSLFLDSDDDDSRQETTVDTESAQNGRSKQVIRNVDNSHPKYTTYYKGKTKYYGCRECPAEDSYPKLLEAHMLLHEPESGAIPCEECGWVVMPDKMPYHRGKRHKPKFAAKDLPPPNLYYFKCPDCKALLCSLSKYREHEQMHESGRGKICPELECGWLVKELARHNLRWHPSDESSRKGKIMYPRKIKLMPKRSHSNN